VDVMEMKREDLFLPPTIVRPSPMSSLYKLSYPGSYTYCTRAYVEKLILAVCYTPSHFQLNSYFSASKMRPVICTELK
jgi:hypothetical protein